MPQLHTIHFNLTKSCNLFCSFCYNNAVQGHTNQLPIKTVEQLASDAAECGCRRVIVSGGEPMVRHDWKDVTKIFDRYAMEVSFATNGTLIDDKTIDFLKTLSNPTLSISLDGGEQIHNEIRGSKTAFQRTLAGIEKLKLAGIPFHVNSVLFRKNLSEIGCLTKLARDYNCAVRLTLLHDNGRANDIYNQSLTAEEILRVREYCHILRKAGVNIFLNLPPLLQYFDEIIMSRGTACGWAVNFCGVLANGDVTICGVANDEPELVAGNIANESFTDIWQNSPLFRETRGNKTSDLKGICGKCPFNEYCGGACRLSAFRRTGDFSAPYGLCQYFYDTGYIPESILEPALSIS
jgi:AdoMet-dependent heme synthase